MLKENAGTFLDRSPLFPGTVAFHYLLVNQK